MNRNLKHCSTLIALRLLVAIYGFAMFIYPWINYSYSWSEINKLWLDWQTLNASVIAILASAIVYKSTKYQTETQIKLALMAYKSLLGHKLADLCVVLSASFKILNDILTNTDPLNTKTIINDEQCFEVLDLVNANKDFSIVVDCIKNSNYIDDANKLSEFLNEMQVYNSRLNEVLKHVESRKIKYNPDYILSCIYSAAILQLKINCLFDYARNKNEHIDFLLTSESIKTAYRNLGLLNDNEEKILTYSYLKMEKHNEN
jgi:hypothetical protein